MKKKCLFLCNTPYQILFAVNYIYHYDVIASIIITDTIADYLNCKAKLDSSNIFLKVYVLKIIKIPTVNMRGQLKRYYLQTYIYKNWLTRYIKLNHKYEEFYFANFSFSKKFHKNCDYKTTVRDFLL